MSVETWTSAQMAGRAPERFRAPLTAPRRDAVERLARVARVIVDATGSGYAEIAVGGEAGAEVSGSWPAAPGARIDLRRDVIIGDGRRVTLRTGRPGVADRDLVAVVAEVAAIITAHRPEGAESLATFDKLINALAGTLGRPVILQDLRGCEVSALATCTPPDGPGVTGPGVAGQPPAQMCRTWPVAWRGAAVGRLWTGPGPALAAAELIFLTTARAVLGAALAP